ncbi:GH92 family glycosyl hydrolase [Pedobacter sandarakinus]|uniref:GH92 family glycosyl hydrolase n=1 Tax=Pedobacter sandarakinus TaxID=353156 RepID=UPI0022457D56|nr:GH92 family glycosyl hydrolase [Pedobacter sandarakinus]MCX2574113.1 GH92 family glycosyl hydrolase [Pedobacter sandarakinus]
MKLKFTLLLAGLTTYAMAQQPDLVKYVNTLQGTNSKYELSYGNTYPMVSMPFAMNTWTPHTGQNGEGWKYQYFLDEIKGFQQSHQCSSWVNDYGVYTLMPVSGALKVLDKDRSSKFKHTNEIAKPNYYKVTFDNGITTEMSPTERGAHLKFQFVKGESSYIVLDGYTKMSGVKIYPKENKITGWVNNARWAPDNFKNYFVIMFDQPFEAYGTWENEKGKINNNNDEDSGKGIGAYVKFKDGATVQVKTASSYIDVAQAELTLKSELGNYNKFEDTKNAAFKVWNNLLNRMAVEGGTEKEKATYYSCVFRANLFSHRFFEINKAGDPYYYSPYDGKIHDGYMYTDNGFWDTFRAQFPLNTIMHPKMQGQYVHALLEAQKQYGWFPAWSQPGETGGMLGNHAISLITDAWVKGIRTVDPQETLAAYYHEATNKGPGGAATGRPMWKEYYQSGFIPYPGSEGSVSQTLESAYDDFCGYQLAKQTGNKYYMDVFSRQMYNYKMIYDPATRFMRGRQVSGDWTPNFDPLSWGGPYTEGNAWHWQWSVFHDVQGLINLMGGNSNFVSKIDSVFSIPNTIVPGKYGGVIHEMTEMKLANMGQYAHGNQPIQHMIYLYNYAGQPWKAQYHVRQVMDKLYNASENGFPGDEDQGQMSSWYVLSAMGIYSVCPGTDEYVLGSPVFNKVSLSLENGKKFIVEAVNNSKENVYIQSATLNGKVYTKNFIKHGDITRGGVLKLVMGNKPQKTRGIGMLDKPFSLTKIN